MISSWVKTVGRLWVIAGIVSAGKGAEGTFFASEDAARTIIKSLLMQFILECERQTEIGWRIWSKGLEYTYRLWGERGKKEEGCCGRRAVLL
jgi:hypothetical protein